MTYSVGGLIQATDYNGFASTTAGANVNTVWSTGSGDAGYGQTALPTVSAGGTVTAVQWANLNNRIASMANHQGTSITSRTNPVATNLITVQSNINTDLTNITTNRGNAVASGTTSSTWSGNLSKTGTTGSGSSPWSLEWVHIVEFPSLAQQRYFWNAGGLIRLDMSKTSTGTDADSEWNTLVSNVGTLYLSGRVNNANQSIAGVTYTGFTRIGGSGTPSPFLSTTGWYQLSSLGAVSTVFQLNDSVSPYSGNYVRVTLQNDNGNPGYPNGALIIRTYWNSNGSVAPGTSANISGGTATSSPFSSFGTAPAVVCRFVPPSSTYLTDTWGTPTIQAGVAG